MRRPFLLLPLLLPACNYASYAPPARAMPLETGAAPAPGKSDMQVQASAAGAVWGFETVSGAASVRHGVSPSVAVVAGGDVLHVNGHTEDRIDRNAYSGRVGLDLHTPDHGGDGHLALTSGVGSGVSYVAGTWMTYDAGLAGSIDTYHTALFGSAEVWASNPVDAKQFIYIVGSERHVDQLSPSRGVRGTLGLEWRPSAAGPDGKTSVLIGAGMGTVADSDNSDRYMAVGTALRIKLN